MDILKEMYDDELEYLIKGSSYANKILEKIPTEMSRTELESLYKKCREYACKSIVDRLKSFKEMQAGKIYHLDCKTDSFFILARVRTNYEMSTIEETSQERAFLSFSILTEKNLSHFPGRVVYGYRTGVYPSMIGYIYHHDADTYAYAKTRLELSELPEELLDVEDLCAQALLEKTYSQVSVESKTKTYVGPIINTAVLQPDVVIAIDTPTQDDLLAAAQRNLPILVLHRSPTTVMNIHDLFFTPDLSNPIYI